MKKIMMIAVLVLLSGCTVSQEHANSMSPRVAYGCATSGGVEILGVWSEYDVHGYCRERVAQLEKAGKVLDVDKDAAMNDVYGG